jgi:hypothetical protein
MSGVAPSRFAVGDRVRVRTVDPDHHTRAPRYVRGHQGLVIESQGEWPLADDRARGVLDPRVEPVYTVRFSAGDLWGGGGAHWVTVDLWQSYLEPVTEVGR